MGSASAVMSWLPPTVLQSHNMSLRYLVPVLYTHSTIVLLLKLLQQNSWSVVNLESPITSAQATIFGTD